jgi:hypothetical protein
VTARAVWVDEQLARSGIERTGELESVRERPWATILRAPTTAGPVWLKAASAATAFEAPLYELLAAVVPDRILTPLSVDVERAWILLPDGGPELGARAEGAELLDALVGVMPQYAGLQRDLAPHAQRMLAAGVNDMRPEVMPDRFEDAIEAARIQIDERGTEPERATLERVEGLRDAVSDWSERLAEMPAPATIDHNDLHPWNILAGVDGGFQHARFYDWGDSVVAHPFASMLLPLGFVERALLHSSADRRPVCRVRDAYLDAFTDLAPHTELVDTLELACRLGKIARTLTWERAIRAAGPRELDERWTSAAFETLASLLGDPYLG